MTSDAARRGMIDELAVRGIRDPRVLAALAAVPRELFVLPELRAAAYQDRALPIAAGQTISQPYMVALMTQELRLHGEERVLEVGTGSGYQAAVLSRLCRAVVTVERIPELSAQARGMLDQLGCNNVELRVGDGSLGWPAGAPYDGIIVTAGSPDLPQALYDQLAPRGRLVIPVGRTSPLQLRVISRGESGPQSRDVCECSFVPLIGRQAWPDDQRADRDEG